MFFNGDYASNKLTAATLRNARIARLFLPRAGGQWPVIVFLRNSHLSAEGNRLQNEAQRLGAPLQIGEDTAAILFLILVSTRIPVGHAVPDGIVEQDCDLAGGRRHGLRLSGTRRQPSIERSEGRIAPPDGRGCQPQQCSCPTGRSPCA